MSETSISQIDNITIQNINSKAFYMIKSNATIINDFEVDNATCGMHFEQSQIEGQALPLLVEPCLLTTAIQQYMI